MTRGPAFADLPLSPRIDRAVGLHFQGDWGQANLHRICGWLSQQFNDRAGPGSRTAIWSGRGHADAVDAVAARRVDLALMTPACLGRSARDGRGMFAGRSHPELRSLGVLPHNDRLVFGVAGEHAIRSFSDLRSRKPPLTIATSHDDGVNAVGYAVTQVFAAHGISREEFTSWGGTFVEHERPHRLIDCFRDGSVDAIIHEAVMLPSWAQAAAERDMQCLPMEDEALTRLEREFGWERGTLPAGYFPGLDDDLVTLDFSGFLVLVHQDMPDDVASLLTWCLCETSEEIERQYRHIPADRSPIGYPIDPIQMRQTPVPLHSAAERYYDEHIQAQQA